MKKFEATDYEKAYACSLNNYPAAIEAIRSESKQILELDTSGTISGLKDRRIIVQLLGALQVYLNGLCD